MRGLEEQLNTDERFRNWEKNQRRGRVWAGLLIIFAAGLYFLKEAGYLIPSWIFTWPVLLIAIGVVSGIKHQFRNSIWIILILIGAIFLAGDLITAFSFYKYRIPLILLLIGLVLIFKPKHRHHHHFAKYHYRHHARWNMCSDSTMNDSNDDFVSLNNLFAGTKKNIISKDFKGGDISNTFGGCELNLMQADMEKEAVITIHQHFGGTKLIVPANWIVKSDIACIFAGVEDERPVINGGDASKTKTLLLKGQVVMGGVEIVSY